EIRVTRGRGRLDAITTARTRDDRPGGKQQQHVEQHYQYRQMDHGKSLERNRRHPVLNGGDARLTGSVARKYPRQAPPSPDPCPPAPPRGDSVDGRDRTSGNAADRE